MHGLSSRARRSDCWNRPLREHRISRAAAHAVVRLMLLLRKISEFSADPAGSAVDAYPHPRLAGPLGPARENHQAHCIYFKKEFEALFLRHTSSRCYASQANCNVRQPVTYVQNKKRAQGRANDVKVANLEIYFSHCRASRPGCTSNIWEGRPSCAGPRFTGRMTLRRRSSSNASAAA